MIPIHLLHEKNRKIYLILICPFIPESIKAKGIKKLKFNLMKDLILTSKNKYIFRLCYKYNQEELMKCFNFDNIRFLICTPLDLITESLLDKINLKYYILIDYLYKGTSYYVLNKFEITYELIEKIINLKKDNFITIIKSNKLTPHLSQMTERDKKIINSLVPLEEISLKKEEQNSKNILDSNNSSFQVKEEITSTSKKRILKKYKH